MKTKIITLAFILFKIVTHAQNVSSCSGPITNNERISEQIVSDKKLSPVYFNYRKRQLKYNDSKMNPIEFLHLCRSINDSAVQLQLARYDAFTKDKEKLGLVALGGGFTAIGMLGTAAGTAGQGNYVITGSLAFFGVVGVLMIPISAIYSAVPHQKRKTVLFRDLPIAYNQYVETQNN
ncbi:MAG: hypothetical protein V4677_11835 [Bacteroidota bacterium]